MPSGTILVVDEPREALAVKTILCPTPYSVLTATHPEQAFHLLESERRIDLVLSEACVPGFGDVPAFLAKVRVAYPQTAVMLMKSACGVPSDPDLPVVVKPFSATALIEKIEGLLVETRANAASLRAAFQWNREARAELETARQTLTENVRRSRRQRCERFCATLRVPGARIPTILLAEDDAGLRYAVSRYLIRCGFHVLDVPDGPSALDLSRRHPGAIDLLLSDLQMPGLDGFTLAPAIEAQRPGIRVLLMTGTDTRLPRATLRKPFELEDLLADIVGLLVRT